MHIPDHMLSGAICPITSVVSAAAVASSAFVAFKTTDKPSPFKFAAVASLIFALQMMNFPIQNGTSGHFLGTTLAIFLLGIPFGFLAMVFVVATQCLVFADGGITVLGANIFNMALAGAIPAMIYFYLNKKNKFFNDEFAKTSAIFFTSWFSIVLASVICSIELALSQVIGLTKVLPAMTFVHSIIGLFEGAITLSIILLLETPKIKNSNKLSFTIPFVSSVAIALLLTPFASGFPDGLEYVANKYAFIREGSTLLLSPLADYTFPFIANESLSTGIAGLAGVLIVFAIVFLSGMLFKNRNDAQKNAV